jgi:hypothetical protein
MTPKITIGDISIDCAEPEKLRDFYADMLAVFVFQLPKREVRQGIY